jgi:hypothetical protein
MKNIKSLSYTSIFYSDSEISRYRYIIIKIEKICENHKKCGIKLIYFR